MIILTENRSLYGIFCGFGCQCKQQMNCCCCCCCCCQCKYQNDCLKHTSDNSSLLLSISWHAGIIAKALPCVVFQRKKIFTIFSMWSAISDLFFEPITCELNWDGRIKSSGVNFSNILQAAFMHVEIKLLKSNRYKQLFIFYWKERKIIFELSLKS